MVKKTTETDEVKRLPFSKEEKIVTKLVKEILENLSIEEPFSVQEVDGGVEIVLDTKDNGILIGYHGEVLEALQLILSLAVSKKLGYYVRVSIEIGEYKKNRSSYLENIAYAAKERAIAENREIPLPNLKSWERRVVHMLFQQDDEVISESVGQGRDRTLVIKPRA